MIAAVASSALNASLKKLDGTTGSSLLTLLREQFSKDSGRASVLADAEEHPSDPEARRRLEQELLDIVIIDKDFAGSLAQLVATSNLDGADNPESNASLVAEAKVVDEPDGAPVRGFPGLTVAAASAQTTAGSDFSIFVLVQNPFDVPITVHQVQTHIPVELLDINQLRVKATKMGEPSEGSSVSSSTAWKRFWQRRRLRREHPGVATAVGTDFDPDVAAKMFRSDVAIGGNLVVRDGSASFSSITLVLPPGGSSDELDAVMRRMVDYQKGVLPVRLQPGDSVVRQFVLRTRSRLFFRPLSHTFQIQANYSVDGVDHTGTVPYQLNIQAALTSVATGSVAGALLGTLVKTFGTVSSQAEVVGLGGTLSALAVSAMASIAVVIAFARKSAAQPLVSIEDFWGGLIIGFSVGYLGFDKFVNVLPSGV